MNSAFSSTVSSNPSSLAGVPATSSLLLNGIENDIRELIKLISSNRKLSMIRDSSERVLLRLSRDNLSSIILNAPPYNVNQQRYVQQKNIQQNQQDLSNNNNNKSTMSDKDEGLSNELSSVIAEILIPYLLACNNRSASSKILIHSIGSMQRILGANSLGPAMRENEREGITKALSVTQSRCDEDPVLDYKVIQTIPLLLSSPHPITESMMKQCLEICFLYSVPRTITSSNKVIADTSAMAQQTFPSSSSSLSNSLSSDNSSSLFSKAESLIKKNWSSFTTGSTPNTSEPIFDIEVSHAAIATLNQTISLLFSRVERDFSNYLANNMVNNKPTGAFSTIVFQTACSMLRELCKACDVVSAHGQIRTRRFSSGAKASSIDSSPLNPLPPPSRTSSGSSSTTTSTTQQNQTEQSISSQQQPTLTSVNSHNSNWFGQGMIELPLGLEIIETILSTNRNLFLHPELQSSARSIVKNDVCNLIVDVLDGRVRTVFTWPTVVRLMRIIIVLICDMKPLISSVSIPPAQQIGWGNTSSAASASSTPTPFTTYVVESLLKTMETANTTSTVIVTPLWHRSLILETLHSLCMTPGFLKSIFDENSTLANESSVAISLFQKLVQVLTQFITKTMATNEAGAVSVDLAAKKTHSTPGTVQSRGLDMLTEIEAPNSITLASVILTATECLVSIADVLAISHVDNSHVFQPGETSDQIQGQQNEFAGERKSTSFSSTPPIIVQIGPLRKPSRLLHVGRSSPSYSHEGEEEINQELGDLRLLESPYNNNNNSNSNDNLEIRARINIAMVNVAWKPMLGTFSLLLQTSNEESMIQFLLRAYMSLTTTCGVLGLNGPRDEFISSLCSFALPPQGLSPFSMANNQSHSALSVPSSTNYLLSPKNLQILKALFNIAHGLGSILGTSWYIVLETFEQLDYIVFANSQRRNLKHNITGIEGGISSSSSSASLSSFSLLSSGNLFRTSEEMADDETSNAASANIQARFQIANMTDDDERVVVDLLRSLFESTRYLNDEAVKNVVIALSQLCFTTLAHMSTRSAPPSYILQNPNSSKLQTVLENSPRPSEMSAFNETMSEPSVNMSFDDYENEDDVDIELIEASMNSQQSQNLAPDNIKKVFKAPTGWSKTTFPKLTQFRKKIGNASDSSSSTNKSETDKNQGKQLDTSYNSSAYGGNKRRSLVQNVYSSTDDRDGLAHRLTYRSPPFALEKLVETTMKNLFRLNEVWDVTSQALISVASVGDPKIRMYAVESLETIVSAAIGMSNDKPGSTAASSIESSASSQPHSTPKKPSDSQDNSKSGRTSPSLFAGISYSKVSNVNLICKITELAKSPHRDTKEAALSSLYRVISNCGLYLDDSWGIIVAELLIILNNAVTVAENENQEENSNYNNTNNEADMSMVSESSVDDRSKIISTSKKLVSKHQSTDTSYLIPSVFKVIQLIMDDYRPNLDAGSLPSLAHCLRSLGEQTIHVNISLTAVHMLWLLCEKCDDFIVISPETQKPIPSSQDRADELRLLIFDLLKWLSLDPRMEVRNSALRTLCSNIVSSSSRLSSKSWKSCACDIMIPLMKLIDEYSSRAASEPVLGEKLGRGTENRMVVHHSRDTAEKQWRETRVTILQGCAKFVRSILQFMPDTFADLSWFHEVWKCLLDDLSKALVPVYDESTSSTSFPPREIALAGISTLQELALTVNGGGAKIKFAIPGMKVVGGTLVRIDEPQQSQAADIVHHSANTNNSSSPAFAVPRKLWNDILSLYIQAYIPLNRHGDQPSSSTHDSDVPTQLTNSIAEMYESQNISPVMHEKETMETFMSTLTKLTRVFRSKARLISSLERAVLVCYQKMAPIPSDIWLSFFFNFKVFMLGSNGEGVDDSWVDFALKAAAIFLEMYESAPPEARAALLMNLLDSLPHYETLQKFHESKSEQAKNRTIIFDSLLVPFVKGGLSILSSKYPVDQVETYWNRLLESIHFTSGERESVRLLNAIMDEARPMFISGSLPESVEEHLLKVLVNLSSFSNITLIGTKRNTNLVKGENISICSVLQLLYLCKALNEILTNSSRNEKNDVENTKTRFSTAITLFSTALCELMKSYLSLDENCSVSSVSTSPKSVTRLLDTDADTIVQVNANQASSSSVSNQERIPVSRDSKEFITATEDMVMIIDEIGNTPLCATKLFDKESDDDNPFSYLRPVLLTILELIVVSSKDVRMALKSLLTKICVE